MSNAVLRRSSIPFERFRRVVAVICRISFYPGRLSRRNFFVRSSRVGQRSSLGHRALSVFKQASTSVRHSLQMRVERRGQDTHCRELRDCRSPGGRCWCMRLHVSTRIQMDQRLQASSPPSRPGRRATMLNERRRKTFEGASARVGHPGHHLRHLSPQLLATRLDPRQRSQVSIENSGDLGDGVRCGRRGIVRRIRASRSEAGGSREGVDFVDELS